MPVERIYVGDDEAYFPDLGVSVKPGDPIELPEAPDKDDPRFETKSAAKKTHPAAEEN